MRICSYKARNHALRPSDLPPDRPQNPPVNPSARRPRKKAKRPRQKAFNCQQAEDQLAWYDRLLDAWLAKLNVASKKID